MTGAEYKIPLSNTRNIISIPFSGVSDNDGVKPYMHLHSLISIFFHHC